MDIKLACMSLMWGWEWDQSLLTTWIDDVTYAGYDGVACFDGQLTGSFGKLDFAERIKDNNLQLISVDYMIDRQWDRAKEVCATMQEYGAKYLVTIAGLATREADPQEIADILSRLGEIALEHNVHAVYHNHTDNTGETLEETEDLVSRTKPGTFFGFVDTGHATKDFAGYSVGDRAAIFLERNWDITDFIEFKDWCEATDLNTEVGAGDCNYDKVFNILKNNNYSGWITVEQNGPMGDRPIRQSAKASCDLIKKELGL